MVTLLPNVRARVRPPQRLASHLGGLILACCGLTLTLALVAPSPVAAQRIRGYVWDFESGEPVVSADVILLNALGEVAGRTITNSKGRYQVEPEHVGLFSITVMMLGYDSTSVEVALSQKNKKIDVDIQLTPDAVELEGLVVEATRKVPFLIQQGFYRRQREGFGYFVDLEYIENQQPLVPSDLFRRIPSVHTVGDSLMISSPRVGVGGVSFGCRPRVLIDRFPINGGRLDDLLPISSLEAIEVYIRPSTVPPRWRHFVRSCGLIVVWTKRGKR